MTTPIVVRTGGAGEALAQIGQAVQGILDPDREKREAFERFLASDPNNVSALAEQVRRNPALAETIFDFVPPEVMESIAATPRTSAQEIEGATTDFLADASPDIRKAFGQFMAAAQAGTDPKQIATLGQELSARIAAFKEPGVARVGAIRDITGATPGQLTGDALNEELNARALELFEGFEGPAQDRTALRNSLEAALVDDDLALAHTRRRELAQIAASATNNNAAARAEEARQQNEAIRMVERTNIGTAEGWQRYLFDVGLNRRGRTILQQVRSGARTPSGLSTDPLVESDKELFDMANAQANRLANDLIGDLLSQNTLIDNQITDIERERPGGGKLMSRSARQFAVSRLNALMLQLHNQYPDEIPLFTSFVVRNGPLRFLDEGGTELETGNPFAQPNLMQRAIERIQGFLGGQRPDIPEEVPERPSPGSSIERGDIEERQQPGSALAQSPAELARAATEQAQAVTGGPAPSGVDPDLIPPAAMFTEQQIDVEQLSENTRDNLSLIAQGREGFGFKELIEFDPRSALNILRAFRIRSPQRDSLIAQIESEIGRREERPDAQ
jgi:hypothetical protein